MHRFVMTLRLWLWRRQQWALARDIRPVGTSEGDTRASYSMGAGVQTVSYSHGPEC